MNFCNFNINTGLLRKFRQVLAKYSHWRPAPERNLDQFYADEETVMKRAIVLSQLADIKNKKILFLGDDDLTSIAFSLFFKAAKITMIDLDRRLLDFLAVIVKKENLAIELVEYDLKSPLPKEKFKDYDIVFLDPPYTPRAVNIWLLRTMEATLGSGRNFKRKKPEFLNAKNYFLCYGYTDRSLERGLKTQKTLTDLGLVIQQKIRNFNHYRGAEAINSQSDLYILQPTPKINIRILDSAKSGFYTNK